jgi:hypothetical protein
VWKPVVLTPSGVPIYAAMIAIFLMSKYNDPKLKVKLPRPPLCYSPACDEPPFVNCPKPCADPGVDVYNSAEDYLLNGFTNMCNEASLPLIDHAKLYLDGIIDCIFPLNVGILLQAFTMLGYGYNYPEAKTIADGLADMLVKMQWGYPFKSGEEMVGYVDRWGAVYRPDWTGTFPVIGQFIDGAFTLALDACPIVRGQLPQMAYKFGWTMPADVDLIYGSWEHQLFAEVMPLRIYEAYKWRLST